VRLKANRSAEKGGRHPSEERTGGKVDQEEKLAIEARVEDANSNCERFSRVRAFDVSTKEIIRLFDLVRIKVTPRWRPRPTML
jgi:hypothetical protein